MDSDNDEAEALTSQSINRLLMLQKKKLLEEKRKMLSSFIQMEKSIQLKLEKKDFLRSQIKVLREQINKHEQEEQEKKLKEDDVDETDSDVTVDEESDVCEDEYNMVLPKPKKEIIILNEDYIPPKARKQLNLKNIFSSRSEFKDKKKKDYKQILINNMKDVSVRAKNGLEFYKKFLFNSSGAVEFDQNIDFEKLNDFVNEGTEVSEVSE